MKTSALLLLGMITVMPAACTAGGDADKVSGEGPKDAITLLREAAADGQAVRSAVTERVRSLVAPQLAPGLAAEGGERVVSLRLAKTGEKASSANPDEPRQGDTGEVAYAFAYQETSPTVQVFAEGTVAASFTFDGAAFILDEKKGVAVDVPRYGVTDIIEGNVQDCILDAATQSVERDAPLYKAEISIYFRDGHFKRIYTDQRGDYVIRAVKGEQITVVASFAGYDPQTVETFVPDEVNFSLCPAQEPLPATVTIEGAVSYANGVSASGALVQAYADGLPLAGSSVANAAGAYRLVQVPVTATSVRAVAGTKSATVGIITTGDLVGVDIVLPNSAPSCTVSAVDAGSAGETVLLSVSSADSDGDSVSLDLDVDAGSVYVTSTGKHAWRLPAAPGVYTVQGSVSDGITTATCQTTLSVYEPQAEAIKVTGGVFHTCALMAGGAIKCWGDNQYGQLGNGTLTQSSQPVAVLGVTDATDLALGAYHTCALVVGGTVKCWGMNQYAQLGDGTRILRSAPVSVTGLMGPAVQISAGNGFSCVRNVYNMVQCWGLRNMGQIGDGTYSPWEDEGYTSAVTTMTASDNFLYSAESLRSGGFHSCVIRAGALTCWGFNGYGQLGLGNHTGPDNCQSPYRTYPYPCAMLATPTLLQSGVVDMAGGQYSTCVLMSDTSVRCFGSHFGNVELGRGSESVDSCLINEPSPCSALVDQGVKSSYASTLTGVSALAVGMSALHKCVNAQGSVYCWGANEARQFANGSTVSSAYAVEATAVTPGLSKLGTGYYHTCGITTGGAVECWGRNAEGQLGNGSTSPQDLPVRVQSL